MVLSYLFFREWRQDGTDRAEGKGAGRWARRTHGGIMELVGRAKAGGGGLAVNRAELQEMTAHRLQDAKALLGRKRWEFAYYAAGYAVECALKSCILARMIYTGWVFEEKWDAKECRSHEIKKLIHLAGMEGELNKKLKARRPRWGRVALPAASLPVPGASCLVGRFPVATRRRQKLKPGRFSRPLPPNRTGC
jgi:HEPN domain-containing protein